MSEKIKVAVKEISILDFVDSKAEKTSQLENLFTDFFNSDFEKIIFTCKGTDPKFRKFIAESPDKAKYKIVENEKPGIHPGNFYVALKNVLGEEKYKIFKAAKKMQAKKIEGEKEKSLIIISNS
jgi:hypothetical protein